MCIDGLQMLMAKTKKSLYIYFFTKHYRKILYDKINKQVMHENLNIFERFELDRY